MLFLFLSGYCTLEKVVYCCVWYVIFCLFGLVLLRAGRHRSHPVQWQRLSIVQFRGRGHQASRCNGFERSRTSAYLSLEQLRTITVVRG